jgi:hypothetical protein
MYSVDQREACPNPRGRSKDPSFSREAEEPPPQERSERGVGYRDLRLPGKADDTITIDRRRYGAVD